MTQRPLRRLTLADLAIVIAGTAGALLLLRMAQQAQVSSPVLFATTPIHRAYYSTAPFLLCGAVSLIIARLLRPRPSLRRVFWQPGTIACTVFLFWYAVYWAILVVTKWRLLKLGPQTTLNFTPFDIRLTLSMSLLGGFLLATSWATLAVSGRWRPEPSWIDRSGRVLGVVLILFQFVIFLAQ
jgi:hypothetical protein